MVYLRLFLPLFIAFALVTCKNQASSGGQKAESATYPSAPIDTAYGFNGCDRAQMVIKSPTEVELTYHHYMVTLTTKPDEPGEEVKLTPREEGQITYNLPMQENSYFVGINRDKAFIDSGTGPDGRQLLVWDIPKRKGLLQMMYTDTVLITSSGRMWFFEPVDVSVIDSLPACPQKAEWEAGGLGVGYARRCLYNLEDGSLTKKSEYKCVPLQ
jgi:hypothetical protein